MRAWIYDWTFKNLTVGWYREVYSRLSDGARVLDVGVGTGGALVRNKETVISKDLRVVGVDYDKDYVTRCRERVAEAGLADRVQIELVSIYDYHGETFDAVYFGASFMLMPDPKRALEHCATLLRPGGRIYFTQTFQEKRSPLVERVKPLLKKITTIDFGKVTYEADFMRVLSEAGVEVVENAVLGRLRNQSYRLIVAVPEGAVNKA
jgi:ubiquinone/menaquinone biosynthesis C-methylase UbiE